MTFGRRLATAGALAAAGAACGGPSVTPVVATAPATTAAEVSSSGRSFSDLGPAHLVPQLGTDGNLFALSPDGLLAVIGYGATDLGFQVWDLDRKLVVAELVPPRPAAYRELGFAYDGAFIVARDPFRAAVWSGTTGKLIGAVDAKGPHVAFDFERPEPVALFYDSGQHAVVLRTIRDGPELFRRPGDEPLALSIAGDRYTIVSDAIVEVRDHHGAFLDGAPRDPNADGPPGQHEWAPRPKAHPPEAAGLDMTTWCADGHDGATKLLCATYDTTTGTTYVIVDTDAKPPTQERLPQRTRLRFSSSAKDAGLFIACGAASFGTYGFADGSAERNEAELLAIAKTRAAVAAPLAAIERSGEMILSLDQGRFAGWDIATGTKRFELNDPSFSRGVAFVPSPSGKLVAIGGEAPSTVVRIYDASTGALVRAIDHGHDIRRVLWNPGGSVLVTTARLQAGPVYLADERASVKLWSVSTGKLLRTFPGAYEAAYSDDDSLFFAWSYSAIQGYASHGLRRLTGIGGVYVYALPSPDGRWVLTPVSDTSAGHPGLYRYSGLELRNAQSGAVVESHALDLAHARWRSDGLRFLVASGADVETTAGQSLTIDLFAPGEKHAEQSWTTSGAIESMDFAAGGKLVVSSVRGLVRASRASDGASIWVMPVGSGDRCSAVVFDENGRFDTGGLVTNTLRWRLGDDLRRSAVVAEGPKVDAARVPNLYASFVAEAK